MIIKILLKFLFIVSLVTYKVYCVRDDEDDNINKVTVHNISQCEDEGTNELQINLVLEENPLEGKTSYLGNITFDIPLDKKIKLKIVTIPYGKNETKPEVMKYEEDGCNVTFALLGNTSVKAFSKCLDGECWKRDEDGRHCPVQSGEYEVNLEKEILDNDLTSSLKSWPKGMWDSQFIYYLESNKSIVGCFQLKIEIEKIKQPDHFDELDEDEKPGTEGFEEEKEDGNKDEEDNNDENNEKTDQEDDEKKTNDENNWKKMTKHPEEI